MRRDTWLSNAKLQKKTICTHFWAHVGLYSRERLPKYAYGHIAFLLSTTFLSTGAKVPQERKLKGTKLFVERKFQGCESSMERKFLDFSLPGSECSTERKFHGSESSLYGLFAPGNESAEERKGQIPFFSVSLLSGSLSDLVRLGPTW